MHYIRIKSGEEKHNINTNLNRKKYKILNVKELFYLTQCHPII